MIAEKITIKAAPDVVFEAIRKQRDTSTRKLQSFDGKIAVINEEIEGVPILGRVTCVWEETEAPQSRIDFKMLRSSKFKESYGAYILTPAGPDSTTLELQVHLDPGLAIPFAGEIANASASKDSKARLQLIKDVAEGLRNG
jgi:hypothetical protein